MEHPTVLKNPYNFFYPLGFILVLVVQFDYETVYYIYNLCGLSCVSRSQNEIILYTCYLSINFAKDTV